MLRVLIFIPAYEAEQTIVSVLDRIPKSLASSYDVEVLVIDDGSHDRTFELAKEHLADFWCEGTAMHSPRNQGYGGNQKLGYQYAMDHNFDVVAMVHGDGQYAPECLPDLLLPFAQAEDGKVPDAVYGSRMMCIADARKGGMPKYKILANRFLTVVQNKLLGTRLSEFHSGYRLYWVDSLRKLPLPLNSNGFDFDTEIIIQVVFSGGQIVERPIPTFYGDEVCRVNGIQYAFRILRTSIKARLINMGLMHDPRFEVASSEKKGPAGIEADREALKALLEVVPENGKVLATSALHKVVELLREQKHCQVYVCDSESSPEQLEDIPWKELDAVLLLDVLERQRSAVAYLRSLHKMLDGNESVRIAACCGNIAFLTTRLMFLLGRINRGGHDRPSVQARRLFTLHSLSKLLITTGFPIDDKKMTPAPFSRSLGDGAAAKILTCVNKPLARLLPGLFAWRFIMTAHRVPDAEALLKMARR